MEPTKENVEVDYLKYGTSGLKVKDLDQLKDIVLGISTSNYFAMAIAFVKLLAIGAYFFIRGKIVAEEILLEKNKQAQAQVNHDADQTETTAPRL